MSVTTLAELFRVAVSHDRADCLQHKVDGAYRPISSAELGTRVRTLATALDAWGIRPGDRIALMAENGPAWPIVDFAAQAIGAVSVPVYATLLPEGAAYVIRDSGARVVFAQGQERLEGLLARRRELPDVDRWIGIEAPPLDGSAALEQILAGGVAAEPAEFDAWLSRARPEDVATLIYTSGTTGDPKGVMLTHANITSNVVACSGILPIRKEWTALSFLPLAHSLERTVDYLYFYFGIGVAYAESVKTLSQNLLEVRPHIFASVPRVYEKVREAVLEKVEAEGGLHKWIFDWALAAGRRALPRRLGFDELGVRARIADRLVFSKIRARFGGRFEYAISGGAPLGREVAEFFWGAGIPLLEGYGLTETSPVVAVNTPRAVRLGTVGKPIPDVDVKIADDGEILTRGPNIMKGYFNHPGATAEVLERDGWFHTGDIGELDADGFLKITDRKKELIVNAYGKNIAPAPIENALKGGRFVAQAVIVGDQRPFLVALIVPNFEALRGFAAAHHLGDDPERWIESEDLRALVQREIDRVNQHHERYEQVRAFQLLPREMTLESGELTPTLKVKRRVVNRNYKEVLDRLYDQSDLARHGG